MKVSIVISAVLLATMAAVQANVVLDLLDNLNNNVADANKLDAQNFVRASAMLFRAVDRAVRRINCDQSSDNCVRRLSVAAQEANFVVLSSVVGPAARAALADNLLAFYKNNPGDYSADQNVGREEGAKVVQERANDGFNVFRRYRYANAGPGVWRSQDPNLGEPKVAYLAQVRPFAVRSWHDAHSRYGVQGPPAVDSQAFLNALEEIRLYGKADTTNASRTRREAASIWNLDQGANYARVFNSIASNILNGQLSSNQVREAASAAHKVSVALADGFFFAYYLKNRYDFWRPIQAIRQGVAGKVAGDASWTPFSAGDTFPEYCDSFQAVAAGAAVLQQLYGDNVSSQYNSPLLGKSFNYNKISSIVEQVSWADLYAGTNFRFSTFGANAFMARLGRDAANRC